MSLDTIGLEFLELPVNHLHARKSNKHALRAGTVHNNRKTVQQTILCLKPNCLLNDVPSKHTDTTQLAAAH